MQTYKRGFAREHTHRLGPSSRSFEAHSYSRLMSARILMRTQRRRADAKASCQRRAARGARAGIPGRSRSSRHENGSHEAAALACYSACGRTRHPQQGRHITALTHSSHLRGTSKCVCSICTYCNALALRLLTRACIPTAHSTLKKTRAHTQPSQCGQQAELTCAACPRTSRPWRPCACTPIARTSARCPRSTRQMRVTCLHSRSSAGTAK